MKRSLSALFHNEEGAVLWIVVVISFIIILIVTSSFTYLLEHRQILQMRLYQLQASELVKNGIVFIKNNLALDQEIDQSYYVEHYSNGRVEIAIVSQVDQRLLMKVSGYIQSSAVQTYKVSIHMITGQILEFEKIAY